MFVFDKPFQSSIVFRDKHSSLLGKFVNYGQKSFIILASGGRGDWIQTLELKITSRLFYQLYQPWVRSFTDDTLTKRYDKIPFGILDLSI